MKIDINIQSLYKQECRETCSFLTSFMYHSRKWTSAFSPNVLHLNLVQFRSVARCLPILSRATRAATRITETEYRRLQRSARLARDSAASYRPKGGLPRPHRNKAIISSTTHRVQLFPNNINEISLPFASSSGQPIRRFRILLLQVGTARDSENERALCEFSRSFRALVVAL